LCALLALVLAAPPAAAAHCRLDKVAIDPLDGPHGDRWRGAHAGVDVLFHNDVADHPVTVFPEPPMTVRVAAGAHECRVDDGGVWARDGVWLSADGRTLVTSESSGSALDLVFRDTGTCAKVGTVDVSGLQWRIQGAALVLRRTSGKGADRRVRLDATCRPGSP